MQKVKHLHNKRAENSEDWKENEHEKIPKIFNAGVSLWIFRNVSEQLFYRTLLNACFWKI